MGPRESDPDPESESREGNEGWTTDFPDDTDATAEEGTGIMRGEVPTVHWLLEPRDEGA